MCCSHARSCRVMGAGFHVAQMRISLGLSCPACLWGQASGRALCSPSLSPFGCDVHWRVPALGFCLRCSAHSARTAWGPGAQGPARRGVRTRVCLVTPCPVFSGQGVHRSPEESPEALHQPGGPAPPLLGGRGPQAVPVLQWPREYTRDTAGPGLSPVSCLCPGVAALKGPLHSDTTAKTVLCPSGRSGRTWRGCSVRALQGVGCLRGVGSQRTTWGLTLVRGGGCVVWRAHGHARDSPCE